MLEHLNDRKHAVEKDPRSPGGQGYTGFEAVLQWVFDQTKAINIYDKNGYILKVNLFHSKCSDYQNPKSLKEEMAKDPTLLQGLRRDPRPEPAEHHDAGPDVDRPPVRLHRAEAAARPSSETKKQAGQTKEPVEPSRRRRPRPGAEDPVEEVKKKLDKDELRKRAIQRLREAIEKGTGDVEKLRKRLEDRLGIELPEARGPAEAADQPAGADAVVPDPAGAGAQRPERARAAERPDGRA